MRKGWLFHIIFGLVIFFARYIPIFHYKTLILDKWYSILGYSNACNSIVVVVLDNCKLLITTNSIMIILSIIVFAYGIINLIRKEKTSQEESSPEENTNNSIKKV